MEREGGRDEERKRVPLRCRHWLRQLSGPLNIKGLHLGIEKSPYASFHLLTGPAGWFTLVFIHLLTVEEAKIVIGSESKGVSSGPCGWARKPQTDRGRKKERKRDGGKTCCDATSYLSSSSFFALFSFLLIADTVHTLTY